MKLLTGLRLPVQMRAYVPEAHGTEGYDERRELISLVRLSERGPDVQLQVFSRGSITPLGMLTCLRRDGEPLLERLFRDTPRLDREMFQKLMDELQEATVRGDTTAITLVRRQLHACLDTMAADLEMFTRGAHTRAEEQAG